MKPTVDLISLRFGRLQGAMPPVGSLSLMATLTRADIDCRLTDTQLDQLVTPFSLEALVAWIRRSEAPILAFSVFNDAIPLLVAALDATLDDLQGRRVFVGGPGVVGIAPRLLKRAPTIEAVIVGEGETVLPILITAPDQAKALPGVYSRNENGSVRGAGMATRENLDAVANIDWRSASGKGYNTVPWSTMRGCPFRCQFCEIADFIGRKVTIKTIPRAVDELERAITALQTRKVMVVDDTFTVNKSRLIALCRELTQRRLDIAFEIFSRTDTIDAEMMEALAAAGCVHVRFGLDGGDTDVLLRIAKNLRLHEAEQTIRLAAQYFAVTASFVWGYPFESLDAFRRMLLLGEQLYQIREAYPVRPQFYILSPSCGTPLFHDFRSHLALDLESIFSFRGESIASRPSYKPVLDIIHGDLELGAPFYHYQHPDHGLKLRELALFIDNHASIPENCLQGNERTLAQLS